MNAPASLAARVRAGERRAIARAITLIEDGAAEGLRAALAPSLGRARIVGVTGPPGAGKSTLVGALVRELLARGKRVAVAAVDPSSPLTGGAVLGDRIRMAEHQGDERVFIRSLASRGHLGGLSATAAGVTEVLDAAGFDVVIVETVGAGQSEVQIAALARPCIVVCPPGLGDDVQALKAGILEIADVLVVNKADLAGAERTERELRGMLALRSREPKPEVLKTVATRGEGAAELADIVLRHAPGAGRSSASDAELPQNRVARFMAADRYGAHLGIELVEAGEGSAAVAMRVAPHHLNFWNGGHGGAIFSLADMALGLACNSRGTLAALIDSHMTFVTGAKEGERLLARAAEVSRSRRIGVYRSDVTREDGTLVASLTGTVYLTGKPLGDTAG